GRGGDRRRPRLRRHPRRCLGPVTSVLRPRRRLRPSLDDGAGRPARSRRQRRQPDPVLEGSPPETDRIGVNGGISMANDPFTIRIFVPDGDPEGVRLIDRMNWTGIGIVVPRAKWPTTKQRREFTNTGVYILDGFSEETGRMRGGLSTHLLNDPEKPKTAFSTMKMIRRSHLSAKRSERIRKPSSARSYKSCLLWAFSRSRNRGQSPRLRRSSP